MAQAEEKTETGHYIQDKDDIMGRATGTARDLYIQGGYIL
jgi:hypothetical protein